MKSNLISIQKVNFNDEKTNKPVKGFIIHYTIKSTNEYLVGLQVLKAFISSNNKEDYNFLNYLFESSFNSNDFPMDLEFDFNVVAKNNSLVSVPCNFK